MARTNKPRYLTLIEDGGWAQGPRREGYYWPVYSRNLFGGCKPGQEPPRTQRIEHDLSEPCWVLYHNEIKIVCGTLDEVLMAANDLLFK